MKFKTADKWLHSVSHMASLFYIYTSLFIPSAVRRRRRTSKTSTLWPTSPRPYLPCTMSSGMESMRKKVYHAAKEGLSISLYAHLSVKAQEECQHLLCQVTMMIMIIMNIYCANSAKYLLFTTTHYLFIYFYFLKELDSLRPVIACFFNRIF